MLSANIVRRVFVASVAGVAFVVAVDMAGDTGGVVITIQRKILVVIKRRRLPCFGAVAAKAIALNLLMKHIGRRFMATLTFRQRVFREQCVIKSGWLPVFRFVTLVTSHGQIAMNRVGGRNVTARTLVAHVCPQQRMRKRLALSPRQFRLRMVAMAGHAVRFSQRLMERRLDRRFRKRHTLGRAQSDVRQRMTGDATTGRCTEQWCVAGKTVSRQRAVPWYQRARTHHQMRKHKNQCREPHQICRDNRENPAALHFQPQNRKMLMM